MSFHKGLELLSPVKVIKDQNSWAIAYSHGAAIKACIVILPPFAGCAALPPLCHYNSTCRTPTLVLRSFMPGFSHGRSHRVIGTTVSVSQLLAMPLSKLMHYPRRDRCKANKEAQLLALYGLQKYLLLGPLRTSLRWLWAAR